MYDPISRFLSIPTQHDHLNNLFGTDEWKAVLDQNLSGEDRETFLRNLYHEQLKGCSQYVWPFQLKDSERDRTIYYLFHCTNHPKGIKVMKDVMYKKGTRGTYSYLGKEHSQISLFSTEPDTGELEIYLLKNFKGEKVTFDEIIDSTLDSPFIEKHVREVLNNLRKEGIIKKVPKTTIAQRGFNGKDIAIFPRNPKKKKRAMRIFSVTD